MGSSIRVTRRVVKTGVLLMQPKILFMNRTIQMIVSYELLFHLFQDCASYISTTDDCSIFPEAMDCVRYEFTNEILKKFSLESLSFWC